MFQKSTAQVKPSHEPSRALRSVAQTALSAAQFPAYADGALA
jgi:uncharacterized protein (DUF934 family)